MAIKEEIIFFDDNDNKVDKDIATKFILRREDENGNLISENFGRIQELSDEFSEETVKDKEGNISVDLTGKLNGRGAYIKADNILYVTKEEYEYLKKIDNETGNRMNFDEIKIKE